VKLSATILARNESPRIARAIKAIRQHVDEVIVLDTGSDDDTMEVARRAGADVIISEPERCVDLGDGFRCLGDFAAARNRAMQAASGDWILIVDADHVVCPPTFVAIKKCMRDDTVHAAGLRYHIAKSPTARPADVVTGAKRLAQPIQMVTLVRRTPHDTDYYSDIIHETVRHWIERRAAEGTRHVLLPDTRVADYSHDPDTRKSAQKDERNRRLLERAIRLDPENPIPHTYLAGMYLDLAKTYADPAEQRVCIDRCADVISDIWDRVGADKRLTGSHLLRLCGTTGLLGYAMGQPELTWRAAMLWEDNDHRSHPDIDLIKGLACEQWGKLDAARAFYEASTTRSADSVGSQHILGSVAADRLAALSAGLAANA
jgi:glycosyltransferase involved in cell wall biosynthesis